MIHRSKRMTMRLFTLLVAACGASAAFDGFGLAPNTAATFDVFYWLQVTNFDVLFDSAPSRSNYIDVWDLCIHAPNGSPRAFDWFLPCLCFCGNRQFDSTLRDSSGIQN